MVPSSGVMNRTIRALLLLALAVVLSLPMAVVARDVPAPSPPSDGELAFVIDVIDGDTIRVDREGGGSERVRYIGIDTPEIAHQPGESDEPWGAQATEANEDLVRDRLVLLERDVSETDRYDRLLRYVWVETEGGWVMVNGELVSQGLAKVRAYEPDTRNHAWFEQLRDEAIEAGRGMYGGLPEAEETDGEGLLETILDLFGWD